MALSCITHPGGEGARETISQRMHLCQRGRCDTHPVTFNPDIGSLGASRSITKGQFPRIQHAAGVLKTDKQILMGLRSSSDSSSDWKFFWFPQTHTNKLTNSEEKLHAHTRTPRPAFPTQTHMHQCRHIVPDPSLFSDRKYLWELKMCCVEVAGHHFPVAYIKLTRMEEERVRRGIVTSQWHCISASFTQATQCDNIMLLNTTAICCKTFMNETNYECIEMRF